MYIQNNFIRNIFILFIAIILSAFKGTIESQDTPSGDKISLTENNVFDKYIERQENGSKGQHQKRGLRMTGSRSVFRLNTNQRY